MQESFLSRMKRSAESSWFVADLDNLPLICLTRIVISSAEPSVLSC
jgi:hypothetical protein